MITKNIDLERLAYLNFFWFYQSDIRSEAINYTDLGRVTHIEWVRW